MKLIHASASTQVSKFSVIIGLFGFSIVASTYSWAGVFNIPHFVPAGNFAVGLEPELIFSTHTSLGVNLKYTHGITDLNNLQVTVGAGGGDRRLRLGGAWTFDVFPDIDRQPGIGVAVQGLYYRTRFEGIVELTAIPYIHKAFKTEHGTVDPFFSVPVGMLFDSGKYSTLVTLVFGSSFKSMEKIGFVAEVGIGVLHAESYISGGITFSNE